MASNILITAWTELTNAEQLRQWRRFLDALDAGGAGYHRYYPVLMPLWDRGDVPAEIEAETFEALEAEMRADAAWAVQHAAEAWCVAEDELGDLPTWPTIQGAGGDLLLGDPPF